MPLATSNRPPSTDRILLPGASTEAISNSIDIEHHLSSGVTPPMLAPNQPPEGYSSCFYEFFNSYMFGRCINALYSLAVYAQSPSSTSSVLAPTGGRTPIFGFHGISPRSNAPRPTSVPRGNIE